MNSGYAQISGPFEKNKPYSFGEAALAKKVKRVSVQLYNNWPFEAFGSDKEMDVFTIRGNELYDSNGNMIDESNFIIGKSGILELDELNVKLTYFLFNKNMPASTLIEVEFE